jgi:Na+/proline symporter
METSTGFDPKFVTLGVMFMGLGGLAAGLVGISLPEGRRLGALFALIAGAGVGLVVVGLGALVDEHSEPSEFVFFLASFLGFVAVCVGLWRIWARWRDERIGDGAVEAPPG